MSLLSAEAVPGELTGTNRRLPSSSRPSIAALLVVLLAACALPAVTASGAEGDPAREEFLKVNYVFNRELYELAIPRYEKLLEDFPRFEDRALVRYALALSHHALATKKTDRDAAASSEQRAHLEAAAREIDKALSERGFSRRREATELLAECRLELGDPAAARRAFEWLRDESSGADRIAASLGVAETLYLEGHYPRAAELFTETLATAEKTPEAMSRPELVRRVERGRFHLAMSLYHQGLGANGSGERATREAAERFEKIARAKGAYAGNARYMAALARQTLGDHESALRGYEELLASGEPEFNELGLYGLGITYFELGRYAEAADKLESLVEHHPSTRYREGADLYRARALVEQGKLRTAARLLAQLRTSDEVGEEANLWLARVYASAGKHASAVTILRGALSTYEGGKLRGTIALELATELIADGRPEEAITTLSSLGEGAEDPAITEQALYLKAFTLHRLKRYANSNETATTYEARHPEGRYRREVAQIIAENHFLAGDYARAATLYEKYLEQHRDAVDAAARLLASYRIAESHYFLKDYAKAVRQFESVGKARVDEADTGTESNTPFSAYHYLLGDAAYRLGDHGRATKELRAYLATGDTRYRQDARFLLAHALQLQGHMDAARDAYTAAIEAERAEGNPSEHVEQMEFELGQIAFQKGEYAAAVTSFKKLVTERPKSRFTPHTLRFLGWIARHENRPEEAEAWYRKLVEGFPGHELEPEALYGLARSLQSQERLAEARAILSTLREKYPGNDQVLQAQLDEAVLLSREKRFGEAVELLATLRSLPEAKELRTQVLYELAWCHRGLSRPDDAVDVYREILGSPEADVQTRARCTLELADVELERGKFETARDLLEKLLSGEERAFQTEEIRAKALYQLCWCYHRLGDRAGLSKSFVALRSEFPSNAELAQAALLAARAELDAHEYEKAQELFEIVLAAKTGPSERELAIVGHAECLSAAREFQEARRRLEEFLERYPSSVHAPRAYFGIGWAQENTGNRKEAVSYYRRAAEARTEIAARAQFQIGQCLAADSRLEDAVVEFLQVPARYSYPEWSARALLQVAGCFETLGDKEKARKYYEEVVTNHSGRDEARLAQERLARWQP